MRTRITAICRGEGSAYIEVAVSKKDSGSSLRSKAHSESGVPLPLEMFQTKSDALEVRLAFATPLLRTRRIDITIEEVDRAGNVIDSSTLKISRNTIRLASKASYALPIFNPYRIRGIDKTPDDGHVFVEPVFFSIFKTDQWYYLAKIRFTTIGDEEAFDVDVLDAAGKPIPEYHAVVDCEQATVEDKTSSSGSLTLRLPSDNVPYCVVAHGKTTDNKGFLGLDGKYCNAMLYSINSPFFQVASPDDYKKLRRIIEREEKAAPISEAIDLDNPLFSIVVPLYRTPIRLLKELVQSVLAQTFSNWELILVNASPEDEILSKEIESLTDPRIRTITLTSNEGISGNTNVGIQEAKGQYVCFLDHDDILSPIALAEYANLLEEKPGLAAIYSDEDLMTPEGEKCHPQFKSDFNLDLLRCHNYITHFLAVRRDYAQRLLLRPEFDGAQDYDLVLRLSEIDSNFGHVPKILYHWRMAEGSTASDAGNKGYAVENGRLALQDHLNRCGISGKAEHGESACYYHIDYELAEHPLVSIVIPNKDAAETLENCVASIYGKTTYDNFEVIVVENNSEEASTFEAYERLDGSHGNLKVIRWENGFNFSEINNFAVRNSDGAYIVFLNNDTEVITPHWLESMLSLCQRSDVGAVGAKLLYPDNTIQHAGVYMKSCASPLEMNGAFHVFQHLDAEGPTYGRRGSLRQDVLAVTAACMMTKRSLFEEAGGFDPKFTVAFNDVDYCFKLLDMGYLIVFDAAAKLFHYESLTRGEDTAESGIKNYSRFFSEQGLLRYKWPKRFIEVDPYFGPYAMMHIG